MEISIGYQLTLNGLSFQNYNISAANFLPFGFGGVIINRQGDNVNASLTFPNNDLTRPWASEAINNRWLASVTVIFLNTNTNLYTYVGQVSVGGWDETVVRLQLDTV